MEEDTEFLKLPVEDQCVHKSWKARENGYKECAKLFPTITDEKSPEFNKFAPLMKKFVTDSNAAAQDKALDAVLAFAENAHVAGRTTADVISGIVAKCFTSPKRTTQDKAMEIILLYCEIEKYEIVKEELLKGFTQKNPKVVCGTIKAVTLALREFGLKVITLKPVIKTVMPLFDNRDKNVRDEAKKLIIEMYRWVGPALRPQLTSLKPIQIQELEPEFDKVTQEKAVPTRYLRSQQEMKVRAQDQADGNEEEEEEEEVQEIDPLDLMSAVNILELLPKDFYEKVEAKKWQERKEALDALLPLSQNMKLESGDYADLVRALKKIITKDTNVMIVALAGQCLTGIAKGLKKKFSMYSISCLESILEKFKEKKLNVVTAMREAADATFQSTTVEAIQECSCTALNHKNPSVKAETASFLARAFCYATPIDLNKKLLKAYATELLKTLNESDSNVRENSAQAIGTMLKVVGEKGLAPFMTDVDSIKMQKIKEFSEKAEIKVKFKAPKPKPEVPSAPKHTKAIRGGQPARSTAAKGDLKPKKPAQSKPIEHENGDDFDFENDDSDFSPKENVPKSSSSSKSSGAKSRIDTGRSGGTRAVKKPVVQSRIGSGRPGVVKSRKEEEVDTSPLLQVNGLKQQRLLDEQRLKTLRWEFTTPRAEFISQLQEQMTKATINHTLYTNMFHRDFKFHIKAIDALSEDLNENSEACVANLDLILRWLTIRFFDTNPSVILKAMDYLNAVFKILSESNYNMTDCEARSFLPFLVMKMGDPKDSIRGPTKSIVKFMCHIYPASKVLPFILEGLTSKNARQRAECLETIGSLIDTYGMNVCHPTPQVMMKEVVKQVADRDNSVRNAALNCLLQVYFKQGEKIYKMIGMMSDKDRSLLEERIKRSSKMKPVITKPPEPEPTVTTVKGAAGSGLKPPNRLMPVPASLPAPPLRNRNLASADRATNDTFAESTINKSKLRPLSADVGNIRARFQINYDTIEKLLIDDEPLERHDLQLEEIPDIDSILNSKVTCPSPISRLGKLGYSSTMNANATNANVVEAQDASQIINTVISQVTSTDVNTVISALSEINAVIESTDKQRYLLPHIDQFIIVTSFQFRHILNAKMSDSTVDRGDCLRVYRSLTHCLMNAVNVPKFAHKASTGVLRDVIQVCINVLLDSRMNAFEDAPRLIRALNVLVVTIINKAHFTNVFSALLKLLHESVKNFGNSDFLQLVMKCNWKAIRILPAKTKELDPVLILQDTHDFMKAYPSNTWADKPTQTPLQTIKTVLHELNKVYKDEILSYMAKVPNGKDSECHKYLIKDLKRLSEKTKENTPNLNALENASKASEIASSSAPMSKELSDKFCEIIAKIGVKETNKDGLNQLYDFKEANPDADISFCLRNASAHFRNYLDRNLKRIELQRKETKSTSNSSVKDSDTVAAASDSNPVDLDTLVDQFKNIAAGAGFDNNFIDSAVNNIYA